MGIRVRGADVHNGSGAAAGRGLAWLRKHPMFWLAQIEKWRLVYCEQK